MNEDLWIIVPNWDKFQHYSDRRPPWIKLYLELNHKHEWLALTDAARGLATRIWLLYAASGCSLHLSDLKAQGWSKDSARHLESLNHAGFIALSASKPAPREEKSREEKNARTREGKPEEQKHAAGVPAAAAYKPFENTTAPPRMDALPDLIVGWLSSNGTVSIPSPDQEAAVITETPEPDAPTEPEPDDEGGDDE